MENPWARPMGTDRTAQSSHPEADTAASGEQALAMAGLSCLDLSGQPFDPGMAVQGMNLEEFEEDEPLIITRMVEPVILWNGRVIRSGMVMLGRAVESPNPEE